ncbi:VOC family protein [Comamonas endophytica]|uniref:VOC family protein n=1 Tax=Comamonas endophytica TaxID=2949090 RepID=A0ABY6GAW3_9BURK|nr:MULTISPECIES: VOC family protein [unclassified Acidovorax]MCD2512075.1 VOC family protein [Acidovorax sp. D4N7]UYG51855.1 VOC family protein [Acidovorax sp. 5MLIR]
MSIRGVHHLQLAFRAGCEQAMRHFYRDLLGLSELPGPAPRAATLRFAAGEQRIDLVGVAQWQPLPAVSHLAFAVQDVQALRERLLAAQLPLVENRCLAGFKRFYLKDPAGNQLEFLETGAAA